MWETFIKLLEKSKIFESRLIKRSIYILSAISTLYFFFLLLGTTNLFIFNINYDAVEKLWNLLPTALWIIFLLFLFVVSTKWIEKINTERKALLNEINEASKKHENLLSEPWKRKAIDVDRDSWTYKTIARNLDEDWKLELNVWLDRKGDNKILWDNEFWGIYLYDTSKKFKHSDFKQYEWNDVVYDYKWNYQDYDECIENIFKILAEKYPKETAKSKKS